MALLLRDAGMEVIYMASVRPSMPLCKRPCKRMSTLLV